MATFSTPRLVKGGIVLVDPRSLAIERTISLQYNPDSLTRTLQAQSYGDQRGDRSDVLRLKGPPVETIRLEADIDATDQLEREESTAVQWGIGPQLAVLESLVYPKSADITVNQRRAAGGDLEILPLEMPLALLVWGQVRVVPVRITEFRISEEAFDVHLNPIRAKVGLGLRVLNGNDLGFDHQGSGVFLSYHRQKERLASLASRAELGALGIGRIS